MNELEKQPADNTGATLGNDAAAAGREVTANHENVEKKETENVCSEESSPALEIAEAADAIVETEKKDEDACAVESSPALDIAEAADAIQKEEKAEEQKETRKNYHAMTREELVDSLKEIVNSDNMERHKEVAAIKQAYYILNNKYLEEELKAFVDAGNDPAAFASTPHPSETELKELLTEFKEKRNAYLESKEEERRKNLEEKNRVIAEINSISEDIDNINLQFTKFQQLQQEFKGIGEVPPGAETELWKNYQTAVEQFYDRLKMNKVLRDLDFKKNLELKTALIEKAVELQELPDPIEAFKNLQSLHEQWREIGPVARDLREDLWNRFKEASTVINKRHQDFFQERKASEQANEAAKTDLCEKVEAIDLDALKTFSAWDEATKAILAFQQEWKGLGFASKKMNNTLFARFRKACDEFFSAKAEYFKKTKEESKENLAKKEALCEKAEALVDKFEDKEAFDQIQALQKEWRTIGVVRRKQGDEVWKRFCTAVDAFYDARKKLFSGRREEEQENLKTKKGIIEQLKAISEEEERSEVIDRIRELQREWQATGHVPFKQKDAVNSEYKAELDRLYGAFDIKENRKRMRRYEGEIKKLSGDESKLGRERDKLVRAIESRQAELKTIENNMGFFKFKTSGSNDMMKEFERKMEKIREEIAQIQEKITLLDKQGKEEKAEKTEKAETVEKPEAESKEETKEEA